MPALAQMKPCRVSLITRSPRRRRTRTDSCRTSASLAAGSAWSSSTSRPSAFETIFCVTTTTSPSASSGPSGSAGATAPAISAARSVPGATSPMPVDREDVHALSRRHRPPPGPGPAPAPGVLMTVGVTTQRTPSASTAAAWAASASSTTSVPTHGAYSRATPTTEGSVPSSAMSRSAGPLSAAPATMGDTATTRSRRATERLAHARDGQERADGDDGVRRAHDDGVGVARATP